MNTLETARLQLRQWQPQDYAPFAAMCADPDVMAYFPNVLTVEESDDKVDDARQKLTDQGWGFWAVEVKAGRAFAGGVGLNEPPYELPFSPCMEIGWHLAKPFWGQGYATEAGRAALEFAFNTLNLSEVVSFTSVLNLRSQAVMRRLGMRDVQQNFEHPLVPEGDRLREHVLYKICRADWLSQLR
jgi:RimJ/RimL family protein N-acetyltransferase